MRKLSVVLCLFFVLSRDLVIAQHCGGKERWGVKGGTDASAAQINLNQVTNIALTDLVHLAEPQLPPSNNNKKRVVPAETHVYRVTGKLIKWKKECCDASTDDDYHLVITDDTGKYSDEHNNVPVQESSFVAEIPNPDCLSGRDGSFETSSPFVNTGTSLDFAQARIVLEQHTPNFKANGSWNNMSAVPVEITGIGYFDRSHRQTGRAWNNIEIHPVLSIKFLNDAGLNLVQPTGPATQPAAPSTSPQWEYQIITSSTTNDLLNKANGLGAQGWELVSVVEDSTRPDHYVGYLKRKK